LKNFYWSDYSKTKMTILNEVADVISGTFGSHFILNTFKFPNWWSSEINDIHLWHYQLLEKLLIKNKFFFHVSIMEIKYQLSYGSFFDDW
jgi:hypothetical protein